jgi:hypothetical protein
MMLIPKTGATLKTCKTRCQCLKGRSGECGHVMGLALTLWRLIDPDAFKTAFGKNKDGKRRKTTEELEAFLLAHAFTKHIQVQGKPEAVLAQSEGTDSVAECATRLKADPVQVARLKREANPRAKAQNQQAKQIRDAERAKRTKRRGTEKTRKQNNKRPRNR